jgi:hypothetical protein
MQLRKRGNEWENIVTNLKILGWVAVVWICVVQNMDQCPAFVRTVINRQVTD